MSEYNFKSKYSPKDWIIFKTDRVLSKRCPVCNGEKKVALKGFKMPCPHCYGLGIYEELRSIPMCLPVYHTNMKVKIYDSHVEPKVTYTVQTGWDEYEDIDEEDVVGSAHIKTDTHLDEEGFEYFGISFEDYKKITLTNKK